MEFLIVGVLLVASFVMGMLVRKSMSLSFGLSEAEEVLRNLPDLDSHSAQVGLVFAEALGAGNSVTADVERVATNLNQENHGLRRANGTDEDERGRIYARIAGREHKIEENVDRLNEVTTVADILGGAAEVD